MDYYYTITCYIKLCLTNQFLGLYEVAFVAQVFWSHKICAHLKLKLNLKPLTQILLIGPPSLTLTAVTFTANQGNGHHTTCLHKLSKIAAKARWKIFDEKLPENLGPQKLEASECAGRKLGNWCRTSCFSWCYKTAPKSFSFM